MKIAIITSAFLPQIGGAEIIIHNLANTLTKLGFDVTVFIPYRYYKEVKGKLSYKIKPTFFIGTITERLPFLQKVIFGPYFKLLNFNNKYDVWNAHVAHQAGNFLSYAPKNVARLVTFHGVDIQKCSEANYGFRLHNKIYEDKLAKNILPNIPMCTAISKSIRNELLSLSYPLDKIAMVPNGINLELFQKCDDSRNSVRSSLGIGHDEFVILTSGRNHAKKGYKDIPLIVQRLEQLNLRFKWVLVGRQTESIEKEAARLGLKSLVVKEQIGVTENNKEYVFPDKNMRDIYGAADCYVFPTIIEGLPMVSWKHLLPDYQ